MWLKITEDTKKINETNRNKKNNEKVRESIKRQRIETEWRNGRKKEKGRKNTFQGT